MAFPPYLTTIFFPLKEFSDDAMVIVLSTNPSVAASDGTAESFEIPIRSVLLLFAVKASTIGSDTARATAMESGRRVIIMVGWSSVVRNLNFYSTMRCHYAVRKIATWNISTALQPVGSQLFL